MKKLITVLLISLFLFGCQSDKFDASYTFSDLTISYPSDLNLKGKVTATYNAELENDDIYITIEKIINDDNYSFDELKQKFEETYDAIFEKVEKVKDSSKYAIYTSDFITGLYYDDDAYYVLIAQDSDGLKDNYDLIIQIFEEVKIKS